MGALRILIVDDNEAVRRGIRSLLANRSEWQICGEAVDGAEAVEKARQFLPELIIMDTSMPRMDGVEAANMIRRDLPESKLIIISHNDSAILRQQAQDMAARGYVAKEDLVRDLLPTIERVAGLPLNGSSHKKATPAIAALSSLAGGGELGRLIREHDWSKTPLGPIEQWPQSLKTSVNLMLNSQQAMWIGWGPEITFLYNDAYISILGLAKHPQSLGRPASEVWSEIWDICGPLADKVFEKGEATFVDDVRLFMNRGGYLEEKYFSFSYSPIHNEEGNIGGLFCPNTDTTAKNLNARRLGTLSELTAKALVEKSLEAACASSFATLAKNADDIPFALLYLVDEDGRYAVLEQTAGVGFGIADISPSQIDLQEESSEPQLWRMNEVLAEGEPQTISVSHLTSLPPGPAQQPVAEAIVLPVASPAQDGSVGVLIAGINPTRPLDSEYRTFYELVAGQVATVIQNARAAEEERKRAEALAEIDRAKTAFFSNVSHEFRTPLTLMLGPIEDLLARSHTDLSPSTKSQLELVNRNGTRLLRLVNTLLDFSRIEAGRMQAIYQATDLATFTIELASVFRSATEKAGLKLELNCSKLAEPIFVDRGMWEKIVLNLLSNAFKFTFEGTISVGLVQTDGAVELRVADTGVGIPAQELPRLFDRFHRIENTRSRTHEGSGIGLALVHELVKLHGGSVHVESTLGAGSTFIVSVPRGSAHLPADRIGGVRTLASTAVGAAPFVEEALRWLPDGEAQEPAEIIPPSHELIPIPAPPLAEAEEGQEKRPFIVVADDNADMRQYLVRLLSERYRIEAVPDGKAALEAVQERTPDLVLSDVMMPNLDGFALLRELRSNAKTQTVPIILLSARAGEESRVEGIERGADDYLIKPFSARELLARVQTHLEMARVRKQGEDALRDTKARLEATLTATEIATWVWDVPNDRVIADPNLANIFSLSVEEAGAAPVQRYIQAIHPQDRDRVAAQIQAALDPQSGPFEMDYRVSAPNGSVRWVTARGEVERDAEGNALRFPGVVIDITQRKLAERALAAERNVLDLIASGSPLPQILGTLARDTESQSDDGMLCSILLFNEASNRLTHGAAPSLPAAYTQAIDGVAIGPNVGSCGTAAFERKPVFVTDIAGDPHWRDYKDLAAAHGLAACCSMPVFSSQRTLLATVAMYYRQPHNPSPHDRQLIERATQLAAIAIERHNAAEALRQRTSQFEILLKEAPLAIYVVDADFRIREANAAARANFGDISNLIGSDLTDLFRTMRPQDYAEKTISLFRHTLETGEPFRDDEWKQVYPDGSFRGWCEWRLNRIPLLDGRNGVVCYFRDITRQVQIRDAIAESEKQLRLATEAAELGIWHWYVEGDRSTWDNDRIYQIFGRDRSQGPLSEQEFRAKVAHPDDIGGLHRALLATIKTGERLFHQGRIIRPDDTLRWVEFTGQAESGPDGSIIAILGTVQDITERKLSEERERQLAAEAIAATAKFRAVFEQMPVLAGVMTTDGILVEANRTSLEMCGYCADDVLGRPFWQTGWFQGSKELQEMVKAATENAVAGATTHKVINYYWADGTERIGEFTLSPIMNEKGEVIFLHPTGVDITDIKRAEDNYRQLAETLDAEVRIRTQELERQSDLLRHLSQRLMETQDDERRRIARELHDSAGQLLAALSMNLEMLSQTAKSLAPELKEQVGENSDLVQQLTREIRTMSYLLHPPLLDESGLAAALSWYVQGLMERSSLSIELSIPRDLGRFPRELELTVFRIVQESLTNIHRHSGSKTAEIGVRREAENIFLEIQDRGRGISPEKLTSIQAHGSGVGIQGMRERVRQFRGKMTIESKGAGTRITVILPIPPSDPS